MKDIHEVLRRKQAQYAELGKQIEALQGAAETLKSVASLLSDETDAQGGATSGEFTAPSPVPARAAAASASSGASSAAPKAAAPARTTVPRWP
jgi:hypothetical protein